MKFSMFGSLMISMGLTFLAVGCGKNSQENSKVQWDAESENKGVTLLAVRFDDSIDFVLVSNENGYRFRCYRDEGDIDVEALTDFISKLGLPREKVGVSLLNVKKNNSVKHLNIQHNPYISCNPDDVRVFDTAKDDKKYVFVEFPNQTIGVPKVNENGIPVDLEGNEIKETGREAREKYIYNQVPGKGVFFMVGCVGFLEAFGKSIKDSQKVEPFVVENFIKTGNYTDMHCRKGSVDFWETPQPTPTPETPQPTPTPEGEKSDCPSVGLKHNQVETRTAFAASEVPWNQTCRSQKQQRTCQNGTVSAWNGDPSFTHETCRVKAPRSCGNIAHGGRQERTRYRESVLPFGGNCDSHKQVQYSTCTDGQFGQWSGSNEYSQPTCGVKPCRDELLTYYFPETDKSHEKCVAMVTFHPNGSSQNLQTHYDGFACNPTQWPHPSHLGQLHYKPGYHGPHEQRVINCYCTVRAKCVDGKAVVTGFGY